MVKYKIMKCLYCKRDMERINDSYADWKCPKCHKYFTGGSEVEIKLKDKKE